jgi:hypothetical protein
MRVLEVIRVRAIAATTASRAPAAFAAIGPSSVTICTRAGCVAVGSWWGVDGSTR